MKRNAFNGGELSPSMLLRSDMDVYHRGCKELTNFIVGSTGGITRRRGMRHIDMAGYNPVRLIPFTYSQELSYLIILSKNKLTIRASSGNHEILAEFTSDGTWSYPDLEHICTHQLNALLLIGHQDCPLMQLRLHEDYSWSFTQFTFKTPPWETIDYADAPILLVPRAPYNGTYTLNMPEGSPTPTLGEQLRVSYYTQRQVAFSSSAEILAGTWHIFGADRETSSSAITNKSTFAAGDKIAIVGTPFLEYFVCTRAEDAWTGSRDFVAGLTSPANYGEDFARAEDISQFAGITPIYGLDAKKTFNRGAKIVLYSGYWNFYTCIKDFTTEDFKNGYFSPENYPDHFISGVPVGDALSCQGPWKFSCSGHWYGSYEIRKNAFKEISADWETLGESVSPIGGAENNVITGSESEEECYLRLFITSSKFSGQALETGFPADSCSNSLIVSAYKRNMVLTVQKNGSVKDNNPAASPNSLISSPDWSWAAFNPRYGYPSSIAVHASRLVLAGTRHQPQTIWFSQTDDLNNFAVSEADTSALHLTMNTETQEAICWMNTRSDVLLLGTQDAEWVVSSGNANSLTAETVTLRNYGHRGSAHIPALRAENRILFCERGSSRVLEYSYQEEYAAYVSTDTTVFASHISAQGGGIIASTLLRKPDTMAVFLLADGTLACMTYNTMHNVNAWHRITTEGHIESICALPSGTKEDKLYLIVNRKNTRSLEVIDEDSPFTDGIDALDYTSTVTPTAFVLPDADARKENRPKIKAYFDSATPASAVRITAAKLPISHTGVLSPGWVSICGPEGWTQEPTVTISISGPYPATILAIQM